jgi:hypothetical protein
MRTRPDLTLVLFTPTDLDSTRTPDEFLRMVREGIAASPGSPV